MKLLSKCCNDSVRCVGHTSRFYVCARCNRPTDTAPTKTVRTDDNLKVVKSHNSEENIYS